MPMELQSRSGLSLGLTTIHRRSSQRHSIFLEEAGVQNGTFNILTPFPGTSLFEKLERQGRILTRDWSKYNSRTDVVYQPKQMSTTELLAGFQYANQRFYSLPSIARRLSRSPVQLWWTLPLNLAYCYHWWREKGRSAV